MNLKDIAQAKTVKKTIELGEDQTVDVFLRPLPFHLVWDSKDEDGNELTQNQVMARRVAYCIVDEKNEPVFTYEQVLGNDPNYIVDPAIVLKLVAIIGETVDLGKYMTNDSQEQKNSGASLSSTELAEKQ